MSLLHCYPTGGLSYRLGCGHYSNDEVCDECIGLGPSPDPWKVAGEEVNLNRLAETRAYRQSKFRK